MTSALLNGLQEHEILGLYTRLRHSQDYIALPMLLPALLLELRVKSVTRKVMDSHQEICDVEDETGLRTQWYLQKDSRREQDCSRPWETSNLHRISRQLTSVSAKLAYCTYTCQVHLPMLDELNQVNRKCIKSFPPSRKTDLERVNARLQANNALLRGLLQASFLRATYLSQRAQAQAQTVGKQQDANANIRLLTKKSLPLDLQPHRPEGQYAHGAAGGSQPERQRGDHSYRRRLKDGCPRHLT